MLNNNFKYKYTHDICKANMNYIIFVIDFANDIFEYNIIHMEVYNLHCYHSNNIKNNLNQKYWILNA